MLEGLKIAVVVPAYQEARLIASTLRGIPEYVDRVIVVDDGSTDGTGRAVETSGRAVQLIVHPENRGVGAAIATGCREALRTEADVVAVMAGDGQMAPEDLSTVLAPLIDKEGDFVKGNRLGWPGARRLMPRHRWLGNHVLSLSTRIALGVAVRDSQCGYVGLNRHALRVLSWDQLWTGYGYPNDLLAQALSSGLRVREVPVRPVYSGETSGVGWWHALVMIPFVIAKVWARRRLRGAIDSPWRTSTSSTAMQTASVPSPSSAMPTRETPR